MKIYMDMSMVEELGLTYVGRDMDETVSLSPLELLDLRGRHKGYDRKHMDFFEEVGMGTILTLKNTGFGWFEVI